MTALATATALVLALVSASPPPRETGTQLRPCPEDHFRQLLCGETSRGAPDCPDTVRELGTTFSLHSMWIPDREALRLDDDLTAQLRQAGKKTGCCFTSCYRAPVRAEPRVTHDLLWLKCIPEMATSVPAKGRPRCPAALHFDDDWFDHIAPFLPDETRQRVRESREKSPYPVVRDIELCCYQAAPIAAIGPQ